VSGGTRQFRTGYWLHFFGNVRAIVAETLMRAAEVSLGVDRPEPVDLPATTVPDSGRHWPVEFFWKCGQPRFEGWVTWRDKAQGRTGQVTVVFCTPATPDEVLSSPGSGGVEAPPPGWQSKWQGMWVCSHQRHRQHLMITTAPTLMGEWLVPFDAVMFTEGVGPIGTWSPDFGSGGVPDAPKAFMRVGEP
jgi:hypothetical protein